MLAQLSLPVSPSPSLSLSLSLFLLSSYTSTDTDSLRHSFTLSSLSNCLKPPHSLSFPKAMGLGLRDILFSLLLFAAITTTSFALPQSSYSGGGGGQINSNSILVALLDSHYTELAELLEKALLLQTLEDLVGSHNLTIFAPRNEALDRALDPDFKRFLLEPRNLKTLQNLILFHLVPTRLGSEQWSSQTGLTRLRTLSDDEIRFEKRESGEWTVDSARVTYPDSVARPDGVIHGIEGLLIPRSVEDDFNRRRSLREITAVKPEGAPEVEPMREKNGAVLGSSSAANPGSPPAMSIYEAMAPGPSLAPAPAPGPGGPHHHFNGERQVKDFIQTLLQYGGYNEMADILVNLTSLATEMGRLVSEGYVLTVLAPNDEAMGKLTTDQLSEPGAPEQIMYYHLIPEYQTEESMYNAVRRFGKIRYDTLRLPHKVVAQEADGSVQFGHSEDASAYLFDPDLYTDGRISVQGIDGVLFPPEEVKTVAKTVEPAKVASLPKRGKLLEVACWMLGAVGQDAQFATCR